MLTIRLKNDVLPFCLPHILLNQPLLEKECIHFLAIFKKYSCEILKQKVPLQKLKVGLCILSVASSVTDLVGWGWEKVVGVSGARQGAGWSIV